MWTETQRFSMAAIASSPEPEQRGLQSCAPGDIYSPVKCKLVFLLEWKAKGLWKHIFMLCTSKEVAQLMSGVRENIQISWYKLYDVFLFQSM